MHKTTQNWLMGCGCGCAVILLIVVGAAGSGINFVRREMKDFKSAVEKRKILEERFGKTREFAPWPDGAIPAERMEAFLGIREAMEPARVKLVESMAGLPSSEEEVEELESKPFVDKLGAIFEITRSGIGLGSGIGDLFERRNQSLLDAEMGLGEYTYIYALAYYVWLEHPVDDAGEGIPIPNTAGRRVRKDLAKMLRNQLDSLGDDASSAWGEQLSAEVESLKSASDRLPWEDGLPQQIAASLSPYRERLEALYVAETSAIELSRSKQRGSMSFETD